MDTHTHTYVHTYIQNISDLNNTGEHLNSSTLVYTQTLTYTQTRPVRPSLSPVLILVLFDLPLQAAAVDQELSVGRLLPARIRLVDDLQRLREIVHGAVERGQHGRLPEAVRQQAEVRQVTLHSWLQHRRRPRVVQGRPVLDHHVDELLEHLSEEQTAYLHQHQQSEIVSEDLSGKQTT